MTLTAHGLAPDGAPEPFDRVRLDYDARFLRRSVIETAAGRRLLVDLPEATALPHGARLLLTDGRTVAIEAEAEALVEVRGDGPHHLMRLAWHLGNRHLPCQIEPDRLLIRPDHVIEHMLAHQGARTAHVRQPFDPEGGAYGAGRVQGHDHGHARDHDHGHDHDHAHDHGHGHHRHD
jgi:urease accessory protein